MTVASIRWPASIAPLVFGVAGAAMILVGTARYGVGLVNDSAHYAALAQNVLDGRGYQMLDGTSLTVWPPLYPTLLALPGLRWPDIFIVARWIDIVCFGTLCLIVARWLFSHLRSRPLAWIASSAILFSVPFHAFFYTALSDQPFILFSTIGLLDLDAFLRDAHSMTLVRSAIFAGLAWLTRYIGLALVVTGVVLVLARRGASWREKLREAAAYGAIPTLLIGPWLVRNYTIANSPGRGGENPTQTFASNLSATVNTVSSWLLPERVPLSVRVVVLTVAVSGLLGLLVLTRRRPHAGLTGHQDRRARNHTLLLYASYVLIYLVLLIVPASINVDLAVLDHRYLGPVFVPIVLLYALVLDDLVAVLPRTDRWRVAHSSLVGLLCLWLIYPVRQTMMGDLREYVTNGPGAYSTQRWRSSQLITYLREHPPGGRVYTNQQPGLYALTGMTFADSPQKQLLLPDGVRPASTVIDEGLASSDSAYLVWLRGMARNDLYTLDELQRWYTLVEVASFADGTVYMVSASNP